MQVSGSEVRVLGFKFWLCHWLAMELEKIQLTMLIVIYKTGMMAVTTL